MHDLLRQDTLHPFAAALLPRAAVRPALRQSSAFLAGLLGGWAVLYGALIPFGLGLTLGFAEDCFAACAAGAVLGLLLHGFGALSLDSICLLCAIGAAVAARWLWPGRFRPALLASCGALGLGAVCFAFGPTGGGVDLLLTCGADALLAGALGFALRRFPPETPGAGMLLVGAAAAAALGGVALGPVCLGVVFCATLDGMNALRPILERNGHLETGDLPAQLGRCIHPAALCATVNKSFALYRSRKETRVHAEAMRTALTEQYSAVADALGVLSEQLGRPGTPEPYKSGRVADFFASLGTPPLESAVTLDDLGRTRAAVTLPRTRFSAPELAALAQEVGRLCRRTFDPPQVLSCKGMTTLLFCEKPALRAVFGSAGSAARGSISGDAVQQFCSPTAAQMILCDGMGTGRPAAVDGNLAAELTARLLKAGFTAELAARLVNVALALKSDEESGATLDLISVDLYTGTARLFKAGAAPGFLVHGGRARPVGDASLPIGILGGVNGQSRVVHLAAGDYAVLVSDGLLVDGTGWVLKQLELSAAAADPPEVLAKTLVETARARAEATGRPDDITAAVLRLEACGR